MQRNLSGAVMMMASMACFTLNDALIKLMGGVMPLSQVVALRGLVASVLIAGLAVALGRLRLRLSRRAWTLAGIRALTEVGAAYFFLTALLNMPLANVSAILQTLPLTVTLGAAVFFAEPVGWRRFSAIAVGFAGVLLIVRPGMEGFSLWSVYALIAVLCVTARDLVTRRMPADVPSLTVTLITSVVVTVAFGAAGMADDWVAMEARTTWPVLGAAVFIVGGYFFSVQVMRGGDVSFVAPFRYTSLVWALVLGWFIFGEWPAVPTLLGACIVVGAGSYTLWREARLKSRSRR